MSEPIEIPFSLHGLDGRIKVFYKPIETPSEAGFDILKDCSFSPPESMGYPMMHAWVSHYAGVGYRAAWCWLQIVTDHYFKREGVSINHSFSVDASSDFLKAGVPFFSYGYSPEIFDAPCHNLRSAYRLDWTASTFLTTMPGRDNAHTVRFLAGFQWGYTEYSLSSGLPVRLLPFQELHAPDWNQFVSYLNESYPAFRFAER